MKQKRLANWGGGKPTEARLKLSKKKAKHNAIIGLLQALSAMGYADIRLYPGNKVVVRKYNFHLGPKRNCSTLKFTVDEVTFKEIEGKDAHERSSNFALRYPRVITERK